MATPDAYCIRLDDGTGKQIRAYLDATGCCIYTQAVVLDDGDGNQQGVLGQPLEVSGSIAIPDSVTVTQLIRALLNCNATIQIAGADIGAANPVPVVLQDPNDATRVAELDTLFQIPVAIDVVHHEIHEGDAFFYSELVTLAAAATRDLLIVSPNSATKLCHLFFDVQINDEVNVRFYEDTTTTDDGTAVAEQNRNRASANAADTVVTHTPTVGAVGTLLMEFQIGGAQGKQFGGSGSIERPEIVLKGTQSKYMLRITALNNNTDVSTFLDWYEHTSE